MEWPIAFSIVRVLKVAEMLEEDTSPASQINAPVIVGWGTKGTYRQKKRMFGRHGIRRFDFLVDSDPKQQGKIIDGLEVFSPQHLKNMDADNTVVITFSIFVPEIEKEIVGLGLTYYSTPISPAKIKALKKFRCHTKEYISSPTKQVCSMKVPSKDPLSEDANNTGIVVQGLFEDDLTIPLIRRFRELYPKTKLVLSTWDTTSEAALEYVRQFVDEIVLLPDLENPGHHNRNRQSFTTQEGLKVIKALGCTHALKVRSDVLICEDAFLKPLSDLWARYPVGSSTSAKGRIIVPESYSRLAMPLHPSDMIMFGHVDDLLKFWDTGNNSTKKDLPFTETIWDYCIGGAVPEVEFTMKYCMALDGEIPEDYQASLEWLCDHFLFIDDEALDVFWPKLALNVTYPMPARLYSHAIWRAVALDGKSKEIASRIDPQKLIWQEFVDSHHKWMPTRCPIDKALSIPQRTSEIEISGYVGLRGLIEIALDGLGFGGIRLYRRNMKQRKASLGQR